jgi:hypothetical protein
LEVGLKPTLFNPEKSFLHLGVVWSAVSVLLVVSAITSGIIIYHTPLALNLSSDGFNYFVSVFRFPLGVLTLIIPIVALLAANHRSEQTKEQIRITGIQNNFANYYKHLEEFVKYVDKQKNCENISGSRYIHRMLYPNSQFGDYGLCEDLLSNWQLANLLTTKLLNNYPSDYMESIRDEDLNEYISIVIKLLSYLHEGIYKKQENLVKGSSLDITPNTECTFRSTYLSQSLELIENLKNVTRILDKLCHFSVEYESLLNEELNNKFVRSNYQVITEDDLDTPFATFEVPQTFKESNEKFKTLLENHKIQRKVA